MANTVGLNLGGPQGHASLSEGLALGPFQEQPVSSTTLDSGTFTLAPADLHFDPSYGLIVGITSQYSLPQTSNAENVGVSFRGNDFERYTGSVSVTYDSISIASVPEPGTFPLAASAALAGLGYVGRRHRRRV
jgi:hypothetical protein